jgi:hypothetical protein
MEIKSDFDVASVKSTLEMVAELTALRVSMGHFRSVYDLKSPSLHPLTCKRIEMWCSRLMLTDPLPLTPEIKGWFDVHFTGPGGTLVARAMTILADKATTINTENVVSVLSMMNQTSIVEVDFIGGQVPQYVMSREGSSNQAVKVVAGIPTYGKGAAEMFKDVGARSVQQFDVDVVLYASAAAVAGKFDNNCDWKVSPIIPPDFRVEGFVGGCLDTKLVALSAKMLKCKSAGVNEIVNSIVRNSTAVKANLAKFEKGVLGMDTKTVQRPIMIGKTKLADAGLDLLVSYFEALSSAQGSKKSFLSNFDIGWAPMNDAVKWSPAISYYTASPYYRDPDGDILSKKDIEGNFQFMISYWGAANNKMREILENRGTVLAYDLKVPPKPTRKVTQEMFDEFSVRTWKIANLFSTPIIPGDIFVSDIANTAMWKNKGGLDYQGHEFVSGVLQGFIVNSTKKCCENLPLSRFVRGTLPSSDHLRKYEHAYPFVIFNTCQPGSREVIYHTHPKIVERHKSDLADLLADYKVDFSSRVYLVTNVVEFTVACQSIFRKVITELVFQFRRLVIDPRVILAPPCNRNWWVCSADFPRLYMPKKMRFLENTAPDEHCAVFAGIMANSKIRDDDDFDFREDAGEPVEPDDGAFDDELGAVDELHLSDEEGYYDTGDPLANLKL